MMKNLTRRLALHNKLVSILGDSKRVYYSPPNGSNIKYPCIIYKRRRDLDEYANDGRYLAFKAYQITCIYQDPDLELEAEVLEHFKNKCYLENFNTYDGLNQAHLLLYY